MIAMRMIALIACVAGCGIERDVRAPQSVPDYDETAEFQHALVSAAPFNPDGGCDVDAWFTSCGVQGFVCDSTGTTCGPACGDGNTVCDPSTQCANTGDCIPPCMVPGPVPDGGAPDGGVPPVLFVPHIPPGRTCLGVGLFEPQDTSQPCIVPCFSFACFDRGGGC